MFVRLQTDPPGVLEVPGRPNPGIVIHVGPSVHIACDRDGRRHRGITVHGDVDIIPAGVPSRWEIREKDTALLLGVPANLLHTVAEQSGMDPSRAELVNRFQIRDTQIEHIGWALKAEMETGHANGQLYLDSLAAALAIHLLNRHSSNPQPVQTQKGGLSGHRLKQVLAYIEDNLGDNLSLKEIATVAARRRSARPSGSRYISMSSSAAWNGLANCSAKPTCPLPKLHSRLALLTRATWPSICAVCWAFRPKVSKHVASKPVLAHPILSDCNPTRTAQLSMRYSYVARRQRAQINCARRTR